jgi:hypothetical protein
VPIAEALIEAGADVNNFHMDTGVTPLHSSLNNRLGRDRPTQSERLAGRARGAAMKMSLARLAARLRYSGGVRQRLLPFQQRQKRRDRIFRGLIIAVTTLLLGGIWAAWPSGRASAFGLAKRAKWHAMRSIGLEPARSEIDAYWRDRRDRREVSTRARYASNFAALDAGTQEFLRAGGMGPDQAEVRWGNYDMTLVLSGQVFQRVESRRQYQLRPGVRSIWFRQFGVLEMNVCVSLLPDMREVRRLAGPAGAEIIDGPTQTTNSWGCRGAEPDMDAPVRGIVLGDSFMQGYLVGDDETPPEQLRRSLQNELGSEVSVLNTGTLGYCPEHYYYTLREFGERFRPAFVVVGLYSNDFGEDAQVLNGQGDWSEQKHWLNMIVAYCRSRGMVCLIAPVPCEVQLLGERKAGNYPGQVSNITSVPGRWFCDATDAFIDEDLKFRPAWHPAGVTATYGRCHLYNADLGDGHLSPRGAAIWGNVVARRLALLLSKEPARVDAMTAAARSRTE